jgi:hypothetical protein
VVFRTYTTPHSLPLASTTAVLSAAEPVLPDNSQLLQPVAESFSQAMGLFKLKSVSTEGGSDGGVGRPART